MTGVGEQLERLVPLPDGREQDWTDVVKRAGARRRRAILVVVVAIVVVTALLLVTPALGVRALVFGDEPTPTWTWPEGIPGDPIPAPKILRQINDDLHGKLLRNRIDISTVRLLVSAGNGTERQSELAAKGLAGGVCLSILGGELGTPQSLSGPGCLEADRVADQAVFAHEVTGGHRGSVVDYATLTGIARADVGRVELELVNGKTIELPMNRWRGFGYYATDAKHFPKTLRVYATWSSFFRSHEKLVGEMPLQQVGGLAPTPLCGGKYGPCPPGVKP